MTLLVLYEELAGYFIKCITTLAQQYNVEVHLIHKDVSKDAPFHLSLDNKIKSYNRSSYSDEQLISLVKKIDPDAIFCGGWSNKIYLKIVRDYKGKIPSIVGFDNNWNGALKQQIARVVAPFFITNKFDKCFVPGSGQKKFALNIGFKEDQIFLGAYCCDFDLFYNQYLENRTQKQTNFPKRLLYVGRYVEHKGILDLWKAFIELQNESPNDWELWCIGTGELKPAVHPKIKHFGFVQPKELSKFIKTSGVFVLPSHFEPWGVVIHEFASAGFPIICSDEVGARTTFVEENYNGYIYKSGNIQQLKNILKKTMSLSNEQLFEMGEHSVQEGKLITPEIWAKTLISLL